MNGPKRLCAALGWAGMSCDMLRCTSPVQQFCAAMMAMPAHAPVRTYLAVFVVLVLSVVISLSDNNVP